MKLENLKVLFTEKKSQTSLELIVLVGGIIVLAVIAGLSLKNAAKTAAGGIK